MQLFVVLNYSKDFLTIIRKVLTNLENCHTVGQMDKDTASRTDKWKKCVVVFLKVKCLVNWNAVFRINLNLSNSQKIVKTLQWMQLKHLKNVFTDCSLHIYDHNDEAFFRWTGPSWKTHNFNSLFGFCELALV